MSESQPRTGAGMAREPYGKAYGGSAPENYERYFVPNIGRPLARELIRKAALRPGERVLDVACGTGVVTRLAVEQVADTGSVAGLDVNPGMLGVARALSPPGVSVAWHEASAESMPLDDASFDVVTCQMGIQFVPDRLAALREMHRVLAPGGRLVLNVPGPAPRMFVIMERAFARHIDREAARFVSHVFSLHDGGEIESLVRGAGFSDISLEAGTQTLRQPEPRDFLWQYVSSTPLAGAAAKASVEQRAALEHEVVEAWQEFVKDGVLLLQARISVATARK